MRVVICATRADFPAAAALAATAPQETLIVTPVFDLAALFNTPAQPVRFLQSYLTPVEAEAARAPAWELCATWHLPFSAAVQVGVVSIASVMQNEAVYMFMAALNAGQAMRRLIEVEKPAEIC